MLLFGEGCGIDVGGDGVAAAQFVVGNISINNLEESLLLSITVTKDQINELQCLEEWSQKQEKEVCEDRGSALLVNAVAHELCAPAENMNAHDNLEQVAVKQAIFFIEVYEG